MEGSAAARAIDSAYSGACVNGPPYAGSVVTRSEVTTRRATTPLERDVAWPAGLACGCAGRAYLVPLGADDGESVDEIVFEERHVCRVGSPMAGMVVVRTNGLDHLGVVGADVSGRMARHGLEPCVHRRHALDEFTCCNG